MASCIETRTLKEILTAIYFILTCGILLADAGQGIEEFSTEKRTCENLAFITFCIGALHMLLLASAAPSTFRIRGRECC